MPVAARALEAALSSLGVDRSKASTTGWVAASCPACATVGDGVIALRINVNTGGYKCYHCGATSANNGPTIDEFAANPQAPSLAGQAGSGTSKDKDLPPLTEDLVSRYSRLLMSSPDVLKDLTSKRGWSQETIQRLQIGYDGTYLWIPIRDIRGGLVNARMYDPFRRMSVKSFHYANNDGTKRTVVWVPFGMASLDGHKERWMFEGEPDAILAAQEGFPTVVITGGAGTWTDEILQVVTEGTEGILCYDMDARGRQGARSVISRLEGHGRKMLDLKFKLTDPKSKDFSDAMLRENRTAAWFRELAVAGWQGQDTTSDQAPPPVPVKLGEGVPGEALVVRSHVLGTHSVPVIVPSMFESKCRMNWDPDRCATCPVNGAGGNLRTEIQPDSKDMQMLAAAPAKTHDAEFKRLSGAPLRCPMVRFEVATSWQIQHLRLIPPMSERQGGDSMIRAGMFVSAADGRPLPVKANQLYVFHGKISPDVLTNEWTLISADARPAEDDVDSFTLDDGMRDDLESTFHPADWTVEAVAASIGVEARSLSRHVTRIYGREQLLWAVDMCYHSVLRFKFRDRVPQRGWISLVVFGDTRTGKSETASAFSHHIGLGKYVMDPANTTYAGLVGGLQQVGSSGKAWTITWGLIPTNDRGMVTIDELSSLSTDDIGKMSGMRSSGIAEITKIRSSSTPARTRLIMMGNPRGVGRTLSSYGTPVEGVMELIGAPEDVARFDLAVAVKGGLDKDVADRKLGPQPPPVPSDLRRALVKFAWSRTADQVQWEEGAEEMCVRYGSEMAQKYDHAIPIVEPSEQDIRIARVSVAAACRTFSTTDEDPNIVLVRKCHVEYAFKCMIEAFDGDLGYGEFSSFRRRMRLEPDAALEVLRGVSPDLGPMCRALLSIRRVTPNSVGMALALDGSEVRLFISKLTQCGAARFDDDNRNAHMVWTAPFMALLRTTERDAKGLPEMDLMTDKF